MHHTLGGMAGPSEDEETEIRSIKNHAASGGVTPTKFRPFVEWVHKAPNPASATFHYRRAKQLGGGGFAQWVSGLVKKGKDTVVNAAKTVSGAVTSRIGALTASGGVRLDYPPSVRSLIATIGSQPITAIMLGRIAVEKTIQRVLNLITLGKWSSAKADLPYDDVFHVFMLITVGGKTYILEKKEVVGLKAYDGAEGKQGSYKETPVPVIMQVPVTMLLDNGRDKMGTNAFFTYDAFKNNCQSFLMGILEGNEAKGVLNLTPEDRTFVKQDITELASKLGPGLQKFAKGLTDFAHRKDILLYGRGFSAHDLHQLHHYTHHDNDDNLDNLPDESVEALHHSLIHMPVFNRDMHGKLSHIAGSRSVQDIRSRIKHVNAAGGVHNETGQSYRVGELMRGLYRHDMGSPQGDLDFADYKGITGDGDSPGILPNHPIKAVVVGGPHTVAHYKKLTPDQRDALYEMHTFTGAVNGHLEPPQRRLKDLLSAHEGSFQSGVTWGDGRPAPSVVIHPDITAIKPDHQFLDVPTMIKSQNLKRGSLQTAEHATASGAKPIVVKGREMVGENALKKGYVTSSVEPKGGSIFDDIGDFFGGRFTEHKHAATGGGLGSDIANAVGHRLGHKPTAKGPKGGSIFDDIGDFFGGKFDQRKHTSTAPKGGSIFDDIGDFFGGNLSRSKPATGPKGGGIFDDISDFFGGSLPEEADDETEARVNQPKGGSFWSRAWHGIKHTVSKVAGVVGNVASKVLSVIPAPILDIAKNIVLPIAFPEVAMGMDLVGALTNSGGDDPDAGDGDLAAPTLAPPLPPPPPPPPVAPPRKRKAPLKKASIVPAPVPAT